jgi:hypothetical protein
MGQRYLVRNLGFPLAVTSGPASVIGIAISSRPECEAGESTSCAVCYAQSSTYSCSQAKPDRQNDRLELFLSLLCIGRFISSLETAIARGSSA